MLALLVAACAPGAPAPRAASAAGTVPRASAGPVGPGASSPIAGPAADPPELAAAIAALPVTRSTAEALVQRARAESRRIEALPTEGERQRAREAHHRAALQAGGSIAPWHVRIA